MQNITKKNSGQLIKNEMGKLANVSYFSSFKIIYFEISNLKTL